MRPEPRPLLAFALLTTVGLLTGCTTLREIPASPAGTSASALAPGARLVVTLHDGKVIDDYYIEANTRELVVGHVERKGRGLDRANRADDKHVERRAIAWELIAKVEHREVSGWRTVALVVIPIAGLTWAANQLVVMP